MTGCDFSVYVIMDYREWLSRRLSRADLMLIIHHAEGVSGHRAKERLYGLIFDADKRVSDNAAYVFSCFTPMDMGWLAPRRGSLIREAMTTCSETKQRLLLKVLSRLTWTEADADGDLLDFCLARISLQQTSVAVRMWAMRLALEQCRWYPELLAELRMTLEAMDASVCTPGVRTARRDVLRAISRLLGDGGMT